MPGRAWRERRRQRGQREINKEKANMECMHVAVYCTCYNAPFKKLNALCHDISGNY